MGADQQYLESIVEQLYEPSLRHLLEDLRDEVRDLIDPQRTERSTNYTSVFTSMAAVFRWLGTPLDIVTDRERLSLRSQAVSPEFREMLGRSSRKAGMKSALGIYAWFHIAHPEAAERFLARLREQAGPDLAVPEFRELDDPPRLFETWEEYAQVVIPDVLEKMARESERAAGYGLGLIRPRPAETDQRSALDMRYFNEATQFVGRKRELTKLDHFVERTDTFLWWQIAGPAGQGKSRLALKLVDSLAEAGWETGFVTPFEDDFLAKIESYFVLRPLLLVVDYASDPDRARLLSRLIRALAKLVDTRNECNHPVRLLVLERQPYDGLFDPDFGNHPEDWASPWHHLLFGEEATDTKVLTASVADRKNALLLEPLSDDQLREIAVLWVASQAPDRALNREEMEALNQFLGLQRFRNSITAECAERREQQERLRRPLFAILAADAVTRGARPRSTDETQSIYELLDYALDHDARQMFPNPAERRRPLSGLSIAVGHDQQRNLAILANIVHKLSVLDLTNDDPNLFSDEADDIEAAHRLLGYSVFFHPEGDPILYAREPDLLAEYQVLRLVKHIGRISDSGAVRNRSGGDRIKQLIRHAWSQNASETYAFLYRSFEDFTHHTSTEMILMVEPDSADSQRKWAQLLAQIIGLGPGPMALRLLKVLSNFEGDACDDHIKVQRAIGQLMLSARFCLESNNWKIAAQLYLDAVELEYDHQDVGRSAFLDRVFWQDNAACWIVVELVAAGETEFALQTIKLTNLADGFEGFFPRDDIRLPLLYTNRVIAAYQLARLMAEEGDFDAAHDLFNQADQVREQAEKRRCEQDRAVAAYALATCAAGAENIEVATFYLQIGDESSANVDWRVMDGFRLSPLVLVTQYRADYEPIEAGKDSIDECLDAIEDAKRKLFEDGERSEGTSDQLKAIPVFEAMAISYYFVVALRMIEDGRYDEAFACYRPAYNHSLNGSDAEARQHTAKFLYAMCAALVSSDDPAALGLLEICVGDLAVLARTANDPEVNQIQSLLNRQLASLH